MAEMAASKNTQKKSELYPEIISLILAFLRRISGIRANLFIIFLKRCEILTSFRELALNIRKLVSDVPTMKAAKRTSSIPSPTYQCTKARFEYMRSNL